MITHYIIMSSSYTNGKRIALDYIINDISKGANLDKIVPNIIKACGEDVSISTHMIQTDSELWNSVVEKDYFFKNVEVIDDYKKFIKLILQDRDLIGLDVAKYILSKVKCTHLKLEKLVYLCYADYLCKYNEKLFVDKIFAYQYGPVVDSVYKKYTSFGYEELKDEDVNINTDGIFEMPSRSRILFAKNGVARITSIDETIEKYGNYTAGNLVDITHRDSSPWNKSKGYMIFTKKIEIKDDAIKKYHYIENV